MKSELLKFIQDNCPEEAFQTVINSLTVMTEKVGDYTKVDIEFITDVEMEGPIESDRLGTLLLLATLAALDFGD